MRQRDEESRHQRITQKLYGAVTDKRDARWARGNCVYTMTQIMLTPHCWRRNLETADRWMSRGRNVGAHGGDGRVPSNRQ